ncbi:photosystem II repair protein PSB27-H1, chloroplastic [Oryza brachyantha]|uniref:photosystem II repair protein PSB27-H1, chloroplastic n=1 Tax=Oryza brachyantha TaxID=4533 RepID=UPI001ADB8854|nr:photosystem II repair protein PSB27-H1, chloroplastic [Oryza brachyantha]
MRPASSAPVPAVLTAAAAVVVKPTQPHRAVHAAASSGGGGVVGRREVVAGGGVAAAAAALVVALWGPCGAAWAASDEEYVSETKDVIGKVRSTINMDRADPGVADAVAELRELSNSWVAKYRREKSLLGRPSFREMYSALNAVSGHYISFGPTAPIPNKRRVRILEEMDTAEKALLRGR